MVTDRPNRGSACAAASYAEHLDAFKASSTLSAGTRGAEVCDRERRREFCRLLRQLFTSTHKAERLLILSKLYGYAERDRPLRSLKSGDPILH